MAATTVSSREFNQDTSRAKRAAMDGPVFITDRGKPAHVLLSIDAYRDLAGSQMTLGEAVAQDDSDLNGAPDFDFTPPRAVGLYRVADRD